jgi:translation initiation factor IF-1
MAGQDGRVEVNGVVTALLPRGLVRVSVDGASDVVAHAADDPGRNFVRLLVGDRVRVELAPRDRSRGRITRRLRPSRAS